MIPEGTELAASIRIAKVAIGWAHRASLKGLYIDKVLKTGGFGNAEIRLFRVVFLVLDHKIFGIAMTVVLEESGPSEAWGTVEIGVG